MFENFPTAFCVAVFIFSPPPFIPPPERGICFGGFCSPARAGDLFWRVCSPLRGGFGLADFAPPPRGIWVGGVLIKKSTKKCPTACMQANEPNATDCFSRSRWHKVGQVSPLLYKRRQDGGPLHSQIFSVQRSLNLLNTGKLALSFVRKRVKRGADSSDGRNSCIVIVARGRQIVCIARVVIVAGAQPGRYKASALYKGRLGACKNTDFFVCLSEIGV